MSRGRVAVVVPVFPARSETFIVSKAAGLVADGWDVHVVCQRRDPQLLAELAVRTRELLKGRVHAGWPHRPSWLAALLAPLAIARCALRRPIRTLHYLANGGSLRRLYLDAELLVLAPDIVHFEFGATAVGRMYLGDALGARTVVSFRGYDLNFVGLDDADFYSEVWKRASGVHALGEDLWKRAQRRGCPPSKVHALIPPAIDTSFFDPGARVHTELVGTPDRRLRIVSVGRLEWKKGYEYALEAVRLLIDQGIQCEYHIIGDGQFHTATAYARYQLGLTDVVQLLGAHPPSEVRREMLWADLMLHAAVSEGFGNAVIEAQSMMLPVVCTSADGLGENVGKGETGFIVPTRDPHALAKALAQLVGDPVLRRRMGSAGRVRVASKFQLPDQIAAFGALYGQVLGNNPVSGRPAERLSLGNGAAH